MTFLLTTQKREKGEEEEEAKLLWMTLATQRKREKLRKCNKLVLAPAERDQSKLFIPRLNSGCCDSRKKCAVQPLFSAVLMCAEHMYDISRHSRRQ